MGFCKKIVTNCDNVPLPAVGFRDWKDSDGLFGYNEGIYYYTPCVMSANAEEHPYSCTTVEFKYHIFYNGGYLITLPDVVKTIRATGCKMVIISTASNKHIFSSQKGYIDYTGNPFYRMKSDNEFIIGISEAVKCNN